MKSLLVAFFTLNAVATYAETVSVKDAYKSQCARIPQKKHRRACLVKLEDLQSAKGVSISVTSAVSCVGSFPTSSTTTAIDVVSNGQTLASLSSNAFKSEETFIELSGSITFPVNPLNTSQSHFQ